MEAALPVQQKTKWRTDQVSSPPPLSCVVNKLLIFEGNWWVISDKNYGRGTRTILFEHHKSSILL